MSRKKRKVYAIEFQLRALRKGSPTSKLVRASLRRLIDLAYTKLGADRKQLMMVWPVVASHALSGMDSPPPALQCLAPSDAPTKKTLQI
eukprot:1157169-Pelagomonas_calceolata.AAC.3